MGFIYSHYGSKIQHKMCDIKIILPIYFSWETSLKTPATIKILSKWRYLVIHISLHLNRVKICVVNRIQQGGSHNWSK